MSDNPTSGLIGLNKTLTVELEFPVVFNATLFFINHQGEYTTVTFNLPPGVYPNKEWAPHMLEGAYRNSLKALKMSTKDLSWRKCSPQEFVRATAGGQPVNTDPKWKPAYTVKLELGDVPEVEGETDADKQEGNT